MPFSWTAFPDVNLLYVRLEGAVDQAGVAKLQQALIDNTAETEGRRQIVDLTLVTTIDLTADDLSALQPKSEELRRKTRPGRVAIVAPSDIAFGLARMYEMMIERSELQREILVVRSISEAVLWLDLPEGWTPDVSREW